MSLATFPPARRPGRADSLTTEDCAMEGFRMQKLWNCVGRRVSLLFVLAVVTAACGQPDPSADGTAAGAGGGTEETAPADGEPATPGSDGGTDGSATVDDGELHELRLTVSTFPLLAYSVPYLAGAEHGFFEEEGLRLGDTVGSEGGGTTVRNLLTGGLDFGYAATAATIQAYNSGAPVVIIGGGSGARIPEYCLAAPEGSPYSSLTQAVEDGASIGYTNPGSGTHIALALTLGRSGYDMDDVDARATGGMGSGATLAASGELDVASFMNPMKFLEGGQGLECIHQHAENVPWYQQGSLITSPQMLEENPDLVRSFLRALHKSNDWVINNTEEAAELYAEAADIPVDVALRTLESLEPLDTWYQIGLTGEGLTTVAEGMRIAGLLGEDEEVPWEDIVVQDFLPEDVERIDVATLGEG